VSGKALQMGKSAFGEKKTKKMLANTKPTRLGYCRVHDHPRIDFITFSESESE